MINGGGLSYNYERPILNNNAFSHNSAPYGREIASYPVKIVDQRHPDKPIILNNVGSGIMLPDTLNLVLIDADNQTMVLENASSIRLSPIQVGSSIRGTDRAKFVNGIATFESLQLIAPPGSQNVEFRVSAQAIESTTAAKLDGLQNHTLTVSFRY